MKRGEREADEAGGLQEGAHHGTGLGRRPLCPCYGFLSLAWERRYTALGDHHYVLHIGIEAKLKQSCMQHCYHTLCTTHSCTQHWLNIV